jgi:uncharacterized protein
MSKKKRFSLKKKSKPKVAIKKRVSLKKTSSLRKGKKRVDLKSSLQDKRIDLSRQEVVVGAVKFTHPKQMAMQGRFTEELPVKYGKDTLVLVVRDPWWVYSYWEVLDSTWDRVRVELKDEFYGAKKILRVYDVTDIIFNGLNANKFFDIHIRDDAFNWYIDIGIPGRSWCVDYGLLLKSGRFVTILRSNIVETPLDGPSWITDEEWIIPEDIFARLYGMGFGFGKSSPAAGGWRKGIVSSPGIASMASPVKKGVSKDFWLLVNCELIVYGATEPDAKVTVQGRPIALRPDGTFTLRFALPDGKQVIPVKAISKDNSQNRSVTPVVTRETR